MGIALAVGFALRSGRQTESGLNSPENRIAAKREEVGDPSTTDSRATESQTPQSHLPGVLANPLRGTGVNSPPPPSKPPVLVEAPRLASRPSASGSADDAALESDLLQVQLMIRSFRDALGENPVGTNAEIMASVLGDNAKQARLATPEGQHLNEKGELTDRWGTPYFFHQLSKTQMEIRSAGPDRVMWTGDDKQL